MKGPRRSTPTGKSPAAPTPNAAGHRWDGGATNACPHCYPRGGSAASPDDLRAAELRRVEARKRRREERAVRNLGLIIKWRKQAILEDWERPED